MQKDKRMKSGQVYVFLVAHLCRYGDVQETGECTETRLFNGNMELE